MPVTFAHPLAVFPVKRIFRNLSGAALICGSCGPDIELFVPLLNIPREWSHSLWGVFATSVPLAILLYLLYEKLFRQVVEESLPWQISIPRRKYAAGTVLLSIVLGVLTHIFWDSFTHENTIITKHISLFSVTVFSIAGHAVIVSKVLQYFSSIAGTALVALYAINQYRGLIPRGSEPEWSRLIPFAAGVILSPLIAVILLGLPASLDPGVLYGYLKPVLTTTTVSFLGSTILVHRYMKQRIRATAGECVS